ERCRDNDDVAELVAWQSDIIEDLMLMCLSKERVSGFFCLNWNDSSVMDATLVGANQSIHPVVKRIAQIWDEN
ncbi:MAG: hypothetical protein WBH50_02835, partial [Fuerstiella sp.]